MKNSAPVGIFRVGALKGRENVLAGSTRLQDHLPARLDEGERISGHGVGIDVDGHQVVYRINEDDEKLSLREANLPLPHAGFGPSIVRGQKGDNSLAFAGGLVPLFKPVYAIFRNVGPSLC